MNSTFNFNLIKIQKKLWFKLTLNIIKEEQKKTPLKLVHNREIVSALFTKWHSWTRRNSKSDASITWQMGRPKIEPNPFQPMGPIHRFSCPFAHAPQAPTLTQKYRVLLIYCLQDGGMGQLLWWRQLLSLEIIATRGNNVELWSMTCISG
jgi:hypothetical protein